MAKLFFIAEIGLNHNGNLSLAKEMINAAKESGAIAVKFQSVKGEKLISKDQWDIKIDGFGLNLNTLGEFWNKVSIDSLFQRELSDYCAQKEIEFLSTPFDIENADILFNLGVKKYKIASGDITHYPLLKHVARKGLPIILSTGASELTEINNAVDFLKNNGASDITLLHCVSLYPTNPDETNLMAIKILKEKFPNYKIGFSDHTIGFHIPLAAIGLGAEVIEKHFTIDKNLPGPDQKISADPNEFKLMVKYGNEIFNSIGEKNKKISEKEYGMRTNIRRSIVAAKDIPAGKILEIDDLEFKRPATGISPIYFESILGKKIRTSKRLDEQIHESDIND